MVCNIYCDFYGCKMTIFRLEVHVRILNNLGREQFNKNVVPTVRALQVQPVLCHSKGHPKQSLPMAMTNVKMCMILILPSVQ